jgi:gliding motility-associated-like protein
VVSVTNPNQFTCDSVHTITTTLLPSDSTFAITASCNPADTGVVSVTNPNQFTCDSVHTITTTLLQSDSTFAITASCNPGDTGVVSVTNPNQFTCDSVHTITTTLLPSDSTFENQSTCNPLDAGVIVLVDLNQFGCDSVHTINTTLLPSANSFTQLSACEFINWIDGNTYSSDTLLIDTLTASNGCDSVSTVQLNINNSSASQFPLQICPNDLPYILPNGVTIDGSQLIVLDTLANATGCDSVVSYQINYAQSYDVSPDFALANYGDSVTFSINNQNPNVVYSYTSNTGEDCQSPCNNYVLIPTEQISIYTFTIVDTVSGCIFTDVLVIEIELYSELNVPNIFTPNGDGSNDIFRSFGKNIDKYQLKIFDRWGGEMFESNQLEDGWDGIFLGQTVESGIYISIIQATGLDGQKYSITQNIKLVR